MPEQQKMYIKHNHVWLLSAGVFLLLVLAAAGPLVYKAFAELNSVHDQELQLKNAAITQAILNNDYSAWSRLVTDEQLKAQVNEGNFSQFVEAYLLLEKGRLDEASLIKEQLGLRQKINNSSQISALISDAIARRDYAAWRGLVGLNYAKDLVTESNFVSYAKALDAAGNGKLNAATRIQYNLNLKQKLPYYNSAHEPIVGADPSIKKK